MAHFPLMVAVSITRAHAELFPCFVPCIVGKDRLIRGTHFPRSSGALKAASDTNLEEACECARMHKHPPIYIHTQYVLLILQCYYNTGLSSCF